MSVREKPRRGVGIEMSKAMGHGDTYLAVKRR